MFNLIKNKNYHLSITDIGIKGEGIGKIEGITVFVKGALPQDFVEAKIILLKKNYAIGKLISIITLSPLRVPALCPLLGKCGGCQIQEMAYSSQLEFKMKKIFDSLVRIGKLSSEQVQSKFLPIIGMKDPYHYRNKAQFAVGQCPPDQSLIGLYSIHSHHIIDMDQCLIQHPIVSQVVQKFREFLNQYHIPCYDEVTHSGLIRHLVIRVSFSKNEVMLCVVIHGKELPFWEELLKGLQSVERFTSLALNINRQIGDTVLGDHSSLLWGQEYLLEEILGIKFAISHTSFFQVNSIQTEEMAKVVMAFAALTGTEVVWDAYCGIGTFSLFLAQKAKKVLGIEMAPSAVLDAQKNATLNHLTNLEFIEGDCDTVFLKLIQTGLALPDILVLDPPRKGVSSSLLNQILESHIPKIIYISCNPDTLARDLACLVEGGYQIEKIQPIDMFAHTVHVETITLLTRINRV